MISGCDKRKGRLGATKKMCPLLTNCENSAKTLNNLGSLNNF